jgi:hypothetical protein
MPTDMHVSLAISILCMRLHLNLDADLYQHGMLCVTGVPAASRVAEIQVHCQSGCRALNRTLILPQMWCYCDQDADAEVLRDCTAGGTDTELPYRCADLFP